LAQVAQDRRHPLEVRLEPVEQFLLRDPAQRHGLLIDPLAHAGQPEGRVRVRARTYVVERGEVALGRVHDVRDDVTRRPANAGGRRLPCLLRLGEREQPLGLVPDDPQDGVLCSDA
jgi:hypothetical protein